VLLNKEADRTC